MKTNQIIKILLAVAIFFFVVGCSYIVYTYYQYSNRKCTQLGYSPGSPNLNFCTTPDGRSFGEGESFITFALNSKTDNNKILNNVSNPAAGGDKPCKYKTNDGRTGSYYPKDYQWPQLPDGTTEDISQSEIYCDQATLKIIKEQVRQR
jgi:hypothetical protein